MININKSNLDEEVAERGKIFLLLFIVAMITLYPLIFVGSTTHDDTEIALNFGWGTGLFETAALEAKLQGRITFFWSYPLLRVPYIFDNFTWYVIAKFSSLFAILAALYFMTIKVTKSDWIAVFALVLFFGFIQNGWDHNALTAYPFAINFIGALFLISIGLFAYAIDKKKIGLAISAGVLYFFSLSNELFVLFFPVYLALLVRDKKTDEGYGNLIKSRRIYIFPVFFSLILYLILYVTWRLMHPTIYDGNSLNALNATEAAKVIGAYSLSAFPFASIQFIVSPAHQNIFMDAPGLNEILANISVAHYVKLIVMTYLFYWMMSVQRSNVESKKLIYTSILVSAIGIFLPNLLLGFIQKHQTWVASGSYSYLYTFYSFLSAIIFIALIFSIMLKKISKWNSLIRNSFFLILSLSLAIISFAVDLRNHFVTNDQKLSHRKLELMSVVIASPAFAEVPNGSVIVAPTLTTHLRGIAATPSSYWSKYIKMKTGKNIEFSEKGCNNNESCYSLIFRQELHSDKQFIVFGKAIGSDHGISTDITLYFFPIRKVNYIIGRYEPDLDTPVLALGNNIVSNIGGGSFAGELKSAAVLNRTQYIRLTGNVKIQLNQITVSNYNASPRYQPLSAVLGDGFYGWENLPNEPSWSWAKASSDMIFINNSEFNINSKIRFEATSLEKINLKFFGLEEKSFNILPGIYSPVEISIDLQPGENKFKITSDRQAIKASESDPRMLSFAIRNLSIHRN
jgi:hypothetical protein